MPFARDAGVDAVVNAAGRSGVNSLWPPAIGRAIILHPRYKYYSRARARSSRTDGVPLVFRSPRGINDCRCVPVVREARNSRSLLKFTV